MLSLSFKPFVENAVQSITAVHVLEGRGYTSGRHGVSYQDERPAANPMTAARWSVEIKPHQEKLLIGRQAFVIDTSGGSFHEKWCRLDLYVNVGGLVDDETQPETDLNYFTQEFSLKNALVFQFQGVRQAMEEIKKRYEAVADRLETDSDTYWTNQIKKTTLPGGTHRPAKDNTGYNPSDKYYT